MCTIYSNKELRFFRLTKGIVDYSTEALRTVFQQEWDYLYPTTPWRNNRRNGQQLLAEERARGSRLYDPAYSIEYKAIKDNLNTGNLQEWDITTLFFALKYSHALSASRSSRRGWIIGNALYQIKEVRNYVIAHAKQISISRSSFERHIKTLLRAVEDLLTKSHSLVKKLERLENETEFQTKDILRYKKLLKDDQSGLLSLEEELERLENKLEFRDSPESDHNKPGSGNRNSENSEIILRLQTSVARIKSQVGRSPSKTRPGILFSKKYIEMINISNFLAFNFRYVELATYLDSFSYDVDIDMKLYAEIQWAAALGDLANESLLKREALKILNSLIPYVLRTNNGVVIYARIKIRKAYILYDLGNDNDAMKEIEEAEQMLSLAECHEDIAEVNIAKANILSSTQNCKLDQNQILHHLDKAIDSCEKATVDKSFTTIQVMLQKALAQLGFYQHDRLEGIRLLMLNTGGNALDHIDKQSEEDMSKRIKICNLYSQLLIAYRKSQTNLAMENKARQRSVNSHLLHDLKLKKIEVKKLSFEFLVFVLYHYKRKTSKLEMV